jgi:hypothetical protein
VSPLRDPLGFDGSPKPAGADGRRLLLRRLLPGLDHWWNWQQSKRTPPHRTSAEPEHKDRAGGGSVQ